MITMENLNDTQLLNEMREQMQLLNRKLEKERITNEQLIRKAMNEKISKLHHKERFWMPAAIILAIPCLYFMYSYMNFSLVFSLVTIAFLITAECYQLYTWKGIKQNELITGDLCNSAKKLIRIKDRNDKWLVYTIPFIIFWFIWFVYENLQLSSIAQEARDFTNGALLGGIVGGIIGGLIGYTQYKKGKKTINELISQIEELTREQEG